MAKYFMDCEFIEGFKKPIKWLPTIGKFNKPYHSIELISIGIVCEDGRTYYAISNEFEPNDANDWVKENVLYSIMKENGYSKNLSNLHGYLEYGRQPIKHIQNRIGRSNYQIACDIMEFVMDPDGSGLDKWLGFTDDYFKALRKHGSNIESPEFYTFYGDYDHVVFCSLFGTMMDLPKTFPMYSRDLKQTLDEKALEIQPQSKDTSWLSLCPDYPKQNSGEHHALNDAEFNFE